MDKITFKIDDKQIIADRGKTILEVARENHIEIPTLCHNDKISRTTSCFVCVIKDKKTGKFIPSCSAYPAEGMEVESSSEEVFSMRQIALNLLLSEHSGDCEAPCTIACPAHAKVEEYVRAGREGDFYTALRLIKERIPLPLSIGRVCPRFCEKDCRRNITGKPVAINEFKRLSADLYYDDYFEELPPLNGREVGIVGAGPGGLAAAYFLRRLGFASTIFEALPEPGGLLRYGIPEFRLPKQIVNREIAHFYKMGIKIQCNTRLGEDVSLEELRNRFDAVVLAVGCWKPAALRIPGEELAQDGIIWLREIALSGWRGVNPGRTVVIGGGSTAMDCLRTSMRLGSREVICLYRRTEKEMPAERVELEDAKEEGIDFRFLVSPVSLRKGENGLILTCRKMELGEPDASGRRRPVPIPGTDFELEADTVIGALGQKVEALEGLNLNKWSEIELDTADNRISGNVFATGDCALGAATIVEAVADARKTALAIQADVKGESYREPYTINVSRGHWQHLSKEDLVYLKNIDGRERIKPRYINMKERQTTFKELFPTFDEEEVRNEGERCIECSCTAKEDCSLKTHSETYVAEPDAIRGSKFDAGYDNRHPTIIHDRTKCIKCGVCVKICSEVINEHLLSQKNRGFSTIVQTAFGVPLPESCKDCGACVEECPTGALDWRLKPAPTM